jgi:hypothetical protein
MAQIILTGSGTWNLPADWNDADNVIEVYGPGGNGATSASSSFSGGGGGGGAYQKARNVPLKALDLLGTVVTAKTYNLTVGIGNGAGLWQGFQDNFDGDRYGTLIQGGGGFSGSGITGGSGGFPQALINNVNYTIGSAFGGSGGAGRASTSGSGGGGGGAGGPFGAGAIGGTSTGTLNTTGRGGGGGNGGGAGSSTSATGGAAGPGAGAGGTGGNPNTNGSVGGTASGSANPYTGAFNPPSYVGQSISVTGGTVTSNYSPGTNTLSFSIYGGGSSVNNQYITLDYQVYIEGSVNFAWNLTVSSDNYDPEDDDAGFLQIDGSQREAMAGQVTRTGNLTLTAAGRWVPIRFWYRKGSYLTAGSDTFSGSIVFSGLVTPVYSGGGGGGAGDGTANTRGGAGGGYGGGGGGSGSATSSQAGAGGPGIIIINYTPVVTRNSNFFMFF